MITIIFLVLFLIGAGIIWRIVFPVWYTICLHDKGATAVARQEKLKQDLMKKKWEASFATARVAAKQAAVVGSRALQNLGKFSNFLLRAEKKLHERRRPQLLPSERLQQDVVQAYGFIEGEMYSDAEEILLRCLEQSPKSPIIYYGLAAIAQKRQAWDEAIEELAHTEKLLAWYNEHPLERDLAGEVPNLAKGMTLAVAVCFAEAKIYLVQEKLGEALIAIEKAVNLAPGQSAVLDLAVEIAVANKNMELARDWLEQLKRVDGEFPTLAMRQQQVGLMSTEADSSE